MKIKPRIDLENRTKLETVIPLKTPFIINVDPSDICNFQCQFCPTGDRELMRRTPGRNYGLLDFELYKKIIDDIAEFEEPIKVLRLYKDGEPLLNKRIADMIAYGHETGCCDRVDTTTNAVLLNPELNLAMIDAGLNRLNISIEGMNSKQYLKFSKAKVNFDEIVKNITHFYENRKQCEIIIKINGDIISEDDERKFYDTFGEIADGVSVEHIMSCWPNFEMGGGWKANKEVGIYGQKINEVMVCPYIFYSFSINSDGTASACFLDWERKLIIGDARIQKVVDIWNGRPLKEMQIEFLKMTRKSHPVCSNCGQMSHGQPDDIDKYADELLRRLTD